MVQTTQQTKKKLSSQDIESLLSESTKYKSLPAFLAFGKQWDIQSGWIFVLSLVIWVLIWYIFDIWSIFRNNGSLTIGIVFFILYIAIAALNFFNSANDVPDVETERIAINTQQSFIQGGIAVFILAFVFLYNIKMEEEDRTNIYKILIVSLLISCLAIIIINLQNNSVNIRAVRKIQQALYNQGLLFFMMGLYMIFIIKTKKI